ncbi:THAP domain-containing protein 10-like [Saccostrea cucullata]|uniref:THAP domain-containing protein 10-like n=1 Tax=Saccostrea cuccullata TaxID=36930 RepID=UPI002ED3B9FD
MVQCAAFNCTVKSGQGKSMFLFPKDPKLKKIWTLKLKRDGFQPTRYTKLCELHFDKGQFTVHPGLAASVGFQPKYTILKPGAIPTIFDYSSPARPCKRPRDAECEDLYSPTPSKTPRKSSALEKIRKKRRLTGIDTVLPRECQQSSSGTSHNTDQCLLVQDNDATADTIGEKDDSNCFSKLTQTTYSLVKRRHVRIQTETTPDPVVRPVLVSTGTQTDESRLDDDLNTSYMSIDDNELEDPDWIPDENNDQLDNTER